ncbi:MAG: flagellin, partial [Pseudomonadota bacterium]
LADVERDLTRASEELTTGRKTDLVAATNGDPTRLFAIERDISLNESRRTSIDLAVGRSTVAQASLAQVQNAVADFGPRLAAATSVRDIGAAERIAAEARDAFSQAVAALNSRFGDRSVFAGAAADGPALADAEDILADVAAAAAAATDPADAIAAVESYFNDPGGFDATGYLGSVDDVEAAEIGPGERLDYAVRGDRQELRDALSALAIAVVGVEGGFPGDTIDGRLDVLEASALRSVSAEAGVIELRSELGVAEERLEQATVRASAEDAFLQTARNRIVERDQFQAATEFTALETQLQTIFSVTARLSNLTLTNFLR